MNNFRKIIAILATVAILLPLGGCTFNELPPKTSDAAKNYIKPQGEIPTQAERDEVQAAREEYEAAIRNAK